jgi:DNA-binding GntR family transcriptional regulator
VLRRSISRGSWRRATPFRRRRSYGKQQVSAVTRFVGFAQLTQEGLLTGGQDRACYVRSYAPLRWTLSSFESRIRHQSDPDRQLDAWVVEVTRQDRRPSETIEVAIVMPPERAAERLELDPATDLAVVRCRVRYADDKAYQLADSYFPEPLVRGTPLMQPRSVSAPGGVLASIGRPMARYVDEILIRMPSKEESDRLDSQLGTPVAEITRTGYVESGTPLRVMISIALEDRNVLVYELDAS